MKSNKYKKGHAPKPAGALAEYSKKNRPSRGTPLTDSQLLYPISVGFDEQGRLYHTRMSAQAVEAVLEKGLDEIPSYIRKMKERYPNPEALFKNYISFFKARDSENFDPVKFFELIIDRPVWLLFTPHAKSWYFDTDKSFHAMNDADDHTRNFVKISTLQRGKALLLEHQHRSDPQDLALRLAMEDRSRTGGKPYKKPICFITKSRGPGGGWPP